MNKKYLQKNNVEKLTSHQGIEKIRKMYKIHAECHAGAVRDIAISQDEKYVIYGSDDQIVRVWSLPEKKNKNLFLKDI